MNQRIIYANDEGGVSIVVPAPEFVAQYGIEAVAAKDVPAGTPYKIVTVADIPSDRTFRAAWEADIADPDGQGADYGAGSVWAVKEYAADGKIYLINRETGEEGVVE
jgi:hypothetical protein